MVNSFNLWNCITVFNLEIIRFFNIFLIFQFIFIFIPQFIEVFFDVTMMAIGYEQKDVRLYFLKIAYKFLKHYLIRG